MTEDEQNVIDFIHDQWLSHMKEKPGFGHPKHLIINQYTFDFLKDEYRTNRYISDPVEKQPTRFKGSIVSIIDGDYSKEFKATFA